MHNRELTSSAHCPKVKFLLVAIDYFMKWVEAKVLATITEAKVQSFVWKNIICRFRIPWMIILDNGRQFDSQNFKDFCSGLGIPRTSTGKQTDGGD